MTKSERQMLNFHRRNLIQFGIYFLIVFGFGMWIFRFWSGHRLSLTADGGLIQYIIIKNIQRVEEGQWSGWTNQLMFYPNENTSAYTDHFYLHSLIALPYHLITHNDLNTYDCIFVIQLIIGITGYFFLAKRFSNHLAAIIISSLYFIYLPGFTQKHPQINFYGFLPWFVHWTLRFVETRNVRYIYAAFLAFLCQALVGIYVQLFVVLFGSLFLLFVLIDLYRHGKLRSTFTSTHVLHVLVAVTICGLILFAVNKPYLDFREKERHVRSIADLDKYHTDVVQNYFIPTQGTLLYKWIGPRLLKLSQGESSEMATPQSLSAEPSFIGLTGILILIFAPVSLFVRHFDGQKKLVLVCLIFLLLLWLFSLGPHIFINGVNTGINGPYFYLYQAHYIFRSIRVTGRIVVFMSLPFALLILTLWNQISELQGLVILKSILLAVIVVTVLLDVSLIRKGGQQKVPSRLVNLYHDLDRIPGNVLLELPSEFSCENLALTTGCKDAEDGYYMFTHIFHHKWTVNGRGGIDRMNSERIIRNLDTNYDRQKIATGILKKNQISLVLIHRDRISPEDDANFKIFIKSILAGYDILQLDHNYVLLQMQNTVVEDDPNQELRLRRKAFIKDWNTTKKQESDTLIN